MQIGEGNRLDNVGKRRKRGRKKTDRIEVVERGTKRKPGKKGGD